MTTNKSELSSVNPFNIFYGIDAFNFATIKEDNCIDFPVFSKDDWLDAVLKEIDLGSISNFS